MCVCVSVCVCVRERERDATRIKVIQRSLSRLLGVLPRIV